VKENIIARRKKPEGETPDEAVVRHRLEQIADNATRSEKVSWDRKMDNMVSLIAKLRPIEDQTLDLMAQKVPILDEIEILRREMVRECVHPYTHLVDHEGTVKCNFCSKRFGLVNGGTQT
jgi:hypothetical protein